MNRRVIYVNCFLMKFNFYKRDYAQKCLKACVNCVLKFQVFFLNLSSKFPGSVRVRTSKYPYMDICGVCLYVQLEQLVGLYGFMLLCIWYGGSHTDQGYR